MACHSISESGFDLLLAKIDAAGGLPEEAKREIRGLPFTLRHHAPREDFSREGDQPPGCCLLLEGFACRYKLVENGQRQILAIHLPGDIPDLQALYLQISDHSLAAITPLTTALIPYAAVRRLIAQSPDVGAALWRDTLIDAAIFREWMMGMGRRSAYQRIAHLLCELVVRLKAVGLSDGRTARIPLNQVEFGDELGLSSVHVNRVLQSLRQENLIRFRSGQLCIDNWASLASAGEFDPGYLHIMAESCQS